MSRTLVAALWAGAISAIVVSVRWGRELQRTAPEIFLGAAPLVGRNFRDGWDWRFGSGLVGAAIVAAIVIVAAATRWYERVRLRFVMLATGMGTGLFAVFLALTDGTDGVLYGAEHDTEYLANLDRMPALGEFVRTYVERIDEYTVHARGHPPGFLVLLSLMDSAGIAGPWTVAMLSVLSTALLPVAVLVAVWAVADGVWVRRVAPFLVVAPTAIWMVTSADAVYALLGAVGVAMIALGVRTTGARSLGWGVSGGLTLGLLLFMTYGGAVFVLVPAAVVVGSLVIGRTSVATAGTVVGGAVVGALAITALWAAAGFWWFDGAEATRNEYWEGSAQFRIWNYFIFANLAAALFAVGPATLHGITQLRDRRIWLLVAGGLLAIAAADLSQLSKAEVERIWLIFYPWLIVAGGAIAAGWSGSGRDEARIPRAVPWLVVQAGCAIALQAALVTKW